MIRSPFWTRRAFVQAGVAGSVAIARPIWASASARHTRTIISDAERRRLQLAPLADPATVRAMAMQAIDAAKSAGATYADVRITRTIVNSVTGEYVWPEWYDEEELAIGVRALVNGTWGTAASTTWSLTEPALLGRTAATIARAVSTRQPGNVELAPASVVTGSWATPIKIDPFTVPFEERIDWATSWGTVFRKRYNPSKSIAANDFLGKGYNGQNPQDFFADNLGLTVKTSAVWRQERAIATTDGSYVTQILYRVGGGAVVNEDLRGKGAVHADGFGVMVGVPKSLGAAAAGWEYLTEVNLEEQVPRMYEESLRLQKLPTKPVDIGRFDVVCDAATTCSFVNATLALATEYDRALGFEAHRTGTSWLGPNPLELLGSFRVGAPHLNVRVNRSMPRGLATVQWDDEAVVPEDVMIVRDGILHDYQTTREQATGLAAYYQKAGKPVRSHGGANAESALHNTGLRAANVELIPGKNTLSFDEMVAGTKRGLAFVNMGGEPDFQQGAMTAAPLNTAANVFEIVNGKLGARITGTDFLIKASELWKNCLALGGAASAGTMPATQSKGEPTTHTSYSVRAVPAVFKNVAIVDPSKRMP